MKKLLAAIAGLSILTGAAFANGNQQQSASGAAASGAKAAGKVFIGMAMPETHVQRWVKDGHELVADAQALGYDSKAMWADANQPTQNQQIQSFLTQGAKGMIIGCVNDGVGAAVTDAKNDNCQIIAYDRIINSTDYKYYITFNNTGVGELQGKAIAEALQLDKATSAKPKYITLFAGSPTDGNAYTFYDGAMSVLNPYIEKGVLKVIGPYPKTSADRATFLKIATTNWEAPVAKQRMENLLANDAAHVTLDAVLAPNDTLSRGIAEALKADAKYQKKLPILTGQDAEAASLADIRDGSQYMTVFKNTSLLAKAAVAMMDQILKGEPINVPGAVLAPANSPIADTGRKTADGKEYFATTYLLTPTLITKDNYKVPIDANFYTADEMKQYNFTK
jgi:putative multiple sugar transport system substrate-binding protein